MKKEIRAFYTENTIRVYQAFHQPGHQGWGYHQCRPVCQGR